MKKPLLLLACILVFLVSVRAQFVTISDDQARTFLMYKYPSCFNGTEMMDTTCAEILNEDSLIVGFVTNGDFVQYFKSLKYLEFSYGVGNLSSLPQSLVYLICTGGLLSTLPPLPPALQYLDCRQNVLVGLPSLPSTLQYLDCSENNQLTNLPTLPSSLQYLKCRSSARGGLPTLPSSLLYLDCNYNGLAALPSLPSSLQYLDCGSNGSLTSLPLLPSSLQHLACDQNQLTGELLLPSSLEYLDCHRNNFTSLSSLPSSLQYLDCSDNKLTGLSALPSFLQHLNFASNGIASLPGLPSGIQYVNCYDNQLTVFPSLPSSLQFLNCSKNSLTILPSLPALLTDLSCYNNQIASLPPLPASLMSLNCDGNLLTTIPSLPSPLTYFSCYGNQLTFLPVLPPSLKSLQCGGNEIANLPILPTSLTELRCENNQLTSLPTLPDSLNSLKINGNNIYCLPIFFPVDVVSIYLDGSKIRCLPNQFPVVITDMTSGLPITLPLCDATNNSNGCTALPVIEGKVFYDYNINGIKDNNEVYRSGARVVSSRGVYSFTNDTGFYQISADTTGTITLSTTAPLYSKPAPLAANFNFNTYDTAVVQNFAIQPDVIKDSLSITVVSNMARARPGFPLPYLITYQNEGTTNFSPATVQFHFDDQLLTYDSSSNVSVSHAGNTLTLNVPSLPYGDRGHFAAYFTVKTTAPLGDTVCVWASAEAKTAIAYNDACNVISGSFDPNDKQSTPILSPEQVSKGGYINYTIRFQNTGTDTAFTVVIADTLSNKLQTNTLQMLCASHLCKATVKDGIAYFEFLNILLPDSNVNEQASHGFVQFRVKPQSNLTLYSQVENKSYIYFDYNKPVLTNTAITIIKDLPLPVSLLSFTGSLQGNQTNLFWQTASEINFSRFEVERSADAVSFKKIGDKLSNANTSGSAYSLTDAQPLQGRNYYRLRIIDKDGSSSYSAVVLVILNKDKFSVLIGPNPGKGKFSIQLFNWNSASGSVRIADMNGRIVYRKESIGRNVSTLPIDMQSLAKGMYMVTIEGDGQKIVQKVVVQ